MRGLSLGLGLSRKAGGAAAPAFTPASLFGASEPGGYWDFTDASSLWQDAAASTAVAADGDPVRRADDLSGNGNHLVASSDAVRPAFRSSGGATWCDWSASDQMTRAASYNMANGCFVAIGWRAVSGSVIAYTLWHHVPASATARFGTGADYASTLFFGECFNAITGRISQVAVAPTAAQVLTVNAASPTGATSLRRLGTEVATGTGVAPSTTPSTIVCEIPAGKPTVPIVGIVMLGRAATAQEIADVEAWLATRAGATLA